MSSSAEIALLLPGPWGEGAVAAVDAAGPGRLRDLEDQVRQLRRELIRVQEEERARIARDLHDEAGHALSAAIFQLDLEAARIARAAPDAHAVLLRLRGAMAECIDTLHGIAFALRPRILEDLGLAAALRSLIAQARAASTSRIALSIDDRGGVPTAAAELAAFRVVQEALSNARKYARATRVSVALTIGPGKLRLVVDDNGVGIARDAAPGARPALGIAGMRERVEMLGGTFAVAARPRRGTRVTATIPFAAGAAGTGTAGRGTGEEDGAS